MEADVAAGNVFICLGQSDWKRCRSQDIAQLTTVTLHPNYNAASLENDIAVADVNRTFRSRRKAKLPKGSSRISGASTSFGYGKKKTPTSHFENDGSEWSRSGGNSGRIDRKLRKLESRILPNNNCNRAIADLSFEHRPANNAEVCIEVSRKRNLCEGDSGGPTFVKGKLAGVASRVSFDATVDGTRATIRKCDGSGPTILTCKSLSKLD